MVMSVMPTRWMTLACWLSRGRSSTADCAWPKVAAKTIAMNTGVSAKFLRMVVPPGDEIYRRGVTESLDAKPTRWLAQAWSEAWLIFQLSVHGDFCVEQLGDRAALFGIF